VSGRLSIHTRSQSFESLRLRHFPMGIGTGPRDPRWSTNLRRRCYSAGRLRLRIKWLTTRPVPWGFRTDLHFRACWNGNNSDLPPTKIKSPSCLIQIVESAQHDPSLYSTTREQAFTGEQYCPRVSTFFESGHLRWRRARAGSRRCEQTT